MKNYNIKPKQITNLIKREGHVKLLGAFLFKIEIKFSHGHSHSYRYIGT